MVSIEIDQLLGDKIKQLAAILETPVTLLVHDLLQFALRARNQTNPEWLRGIDDGTLGTGIFLIPDVSKNEVGAVQKVVVPDLTYEDCVRRGQAAIAFKWVPHMVASFEQLTTGVCGV